VARANGDVGVFISIGGLESAVYELRVSDASLTAVQDIAGETIIERCLPSEYQATGLYDDGSVRNLAGVNWTLAAADVNKARLQVNPDATVTVIALNPGAVTLTAALSGFSFPRAIEISDSLTALTVSPVSASIDVDESTRFAAFGTYSGAAPGSADSTTSRTPVNVTATVDWQIATGIDNASVGNAADTKGLVTGLSSGIATLTASCGALQSPVVVVNVSDSADNDSDVLSFLQDNPILLLPGSAAIVLSVSNGTTFDPDNLLDNDDLTWEFVPDNSLTPAIDLVLDGPSAGQIRPLVVSGGGTINVRDPDSGATGSIRVEVRSN
jgi:hypothetical protein